MKKRTRLKKRKKGKRSAAPVPESAGAAKKLKEDPVVTEEEPGLSAEEAALDAMKEAPKESLYAYFDRIRGERVLGEDEEKSLIRKAKKGDLRAREALVKANLKLVVKMAKKYEYFGVPLIDLIEEGNIGLMRAMEKFDLKRGFRFSTYATWWIKQSVSRAIANQKNTIRIPVHILDIYHKYLKFVEQSIKERGVMPDRAMASRHLRIEETKLNEILNIIKSPKSLDLEYEGDDGDSGRTLKDTIVDTAVSKPDEEFLENDRNEMIAKMVLALKPNEQQVIVHRFGLNNEPILTLEDIGKKLKLTRERIRQIEAIAIKKLRYLNKQSESKE